MKYQISFILFNKKYENRSDKNIKTPRKIQKERETKSNVVNQQKEWKTTA